MTPTARALAECRSRGWPACVVERHNTFSGKKHDAFGFGDMLAIDGQLGALLIQVTSTGVSARRKKILHQCTDDARAWLEMGNRIEVWGYAKRVHKFKNGNKTMRYKLRVVPVTLGDFEQ